MAADREEDLREAQRKRHERESRSFHETQERVNESKRRSGYSALRINEAGHRESDTRMRENLQQQQQQLRLRDKGKGHETEHRRYWEHQRMDQRGSDSRTRFDQRNPYYWRGSESDETNPYRRWKEEYRTRFDERTPYWRGSEHGKCWRYIQTGTCHFGYKCRYDHPEPQPQVARSMNWRPSEPERRYNERTHIESAGFRPEKRARTIPYFQERDSRERFQDFEEMENRRVYAQENLRGHRREAQYYREEQRPRERFEYMSQEKDSRQRFQDFEEMENRRVYGREDQEYREEQRSRERFESTSQSAQGFLRAQKEESKEKWREDQYNQQEQRQRDRLWMQEYKPQGQLYSERPQYKPMEPRSDEEREPSYNPMEPRSDEES